MVYYIKATPDVAKLFANLKLRNSTKDGNVLLWIGDLNAVPGDTIAERAEYVGGALLTPEQARDEYFGKDGYTPADCHTPDRYKSEKNEEDSTSPSESDNEEESEVTDE